MTIDKVSWGFRRNINMSTIMTMDEMVFEIVSTGLILIMLSLKFRIRMNLIGDYRT